MDRYFEPTVGAYNPKAPRDRYLLKFQIRDGVSHCGLHKYEHSVVDGDYAEAIERSFVDSDDAGTFSWCLRNCKRICETLPCFTPNKLMSDIITVLNVCDIEIIASVLSESFGYNHFYFVSKVIDFRQNLMKQWRSKIKSLAFKVFNKTVGDIEYEQLDKLLIKQTGKNIEKHNNRLEDAISNLSPKDLLDYVYLDLECDQRLKNLPGKLQRITLNTIREENEIYEKFTVPPSDFQIKENLDGLVAISSLPVWAQKAFSGVEALNTIQSIIFNTAFNTTQNMLISAPTGSGKTNVALLCVLQNFRIFFETARFCGKVIYITPMKALASEITSKFAVALSPLGLNVQEVTGDTRVTRSELESIDVIVTTPEKFDVITRNSFFTGTQSDESFLSKIGCLIIDEIHLLNDERGAVVEIIVARIFRLIESTQVARRVIGMSATLSNWEDVARFLRVSPGNAYHFGREYRLVPLEQIFYGVKRDAAQTMLDICFKHAVETLENGKQCIIFVHTRNETLSTALKLIEIINVSGRSVLFTPSQDSYRQFHGRLGRNKLDTLRSLAEYSLSIHHAGMSRSEKNLVEDMFKAGFIKVLISTSTLAWGVNLPAHCVIIKGTFIGGVGIDRNINNMELTQMMGRAGRPQFDTSGRGILITEHKNLQSYIRMQTESIPIESTLHKRLENALNAEIAMGTIHNEKDAIFWLQYTYLYVRVFKDPLTYGITGTNNNDTVLKYMQDLVNEAGMNLHRCKLIRFCKHTGEFVSTDLGRIAARYYVDYETIYTFSVSISPGMYCGTSMVSLTQSGANYSAGYDDSRSKDLEDCDADYIIKEECILETLCECREFEGLLYRDEEYDELMRLMKNCYYKPKACVSNVKSKVSVLIQSHISRAFIKDHSLISDLNFVVQNVGRLLRAYFEVSICETVSGPPVGDLIYKWVLMFERQLWDFKTHGLNILRHFCHPYHALYDSTRAICGDRSSLLSENTASRLDMFNLDQLMNLSSQEIYDVVKSKSETIKVCNFMRYIPYPKVKILSQSVTGRISKVCVSIGLSNEWSARWNGNDESFHLWICSRSSLLLKNKITLTMSKTENTTEMFIPLHDLNEPLTVRIFSCRWLCLVFEEQLILPRNALEEDRYTSLQDLLPLPTRALRNSLYTSLYGYKYFNPIQTQIFAQCYLTDGNILVGAPTGSGKTVIAELAILRLFNTQPNRKAVYITPLKALAREKLLDWSGRFGLFKRVIEMTGDSSVVASEVANSDLVVTTPEKWDGISRHWKRREFVRSVGLVIIDEVHLLGESRGAVLESIIIRLGFISKHTKEHIRIVCLSTVLANFQQIGDWLSVSPCRLFNFSPAVRPVKCNLYIDGFPLKAYCPRMNSMNKPVFDTIMKHGYSSPVLVFVSSRRQTRTTAQDFVGLLQINSTTWSTSSRISVQFQDEYLENFVEHGIGIHHAGLHEADRHKIEVMFSNGQIKVLVATSTLAWGVNLPAKVVFVKGTEYYDGKSKKYVDYSIADIMQMVGRAGRSICDRECYAYIYTETKKVGFYKAFMFSPFPTESFFHERLLDCLNSEIASGTIASRAKAIEYLKSTFFYKRLQANPQYYFNELILKNEKDTTLGRNSRDARVKVEELLNHLISTTIEELLKLGCISSRHTEDSIFMLGHENLVPTISGILASQYYVSCHTVCDFSEAISQTGKRTSNKNLSFFELLRILANASEFSQVPMRHNEDLYNMQLSERAMQPIKESEASDPHSKTFLLFQAFIFNLKLPIFDYNNDTMSILDQLPRIIQTLIDIIVVHRNFKNVQYVLLLYKCLMCRGNPLDLKLSLESAFDMDIKVFDVKNPNNNIIRKKVISETEQCYMYDVRNVRELDIKVSLSALDNGSDNSCYIILGNEDSNVIYGFKKTTETSRNALFRIRLDSSKRLSLITKVILTSCTQPVFDRQQTLIFKS